MNNGNAKIDVKTILKSTATSRQQFAAMAGLNPATVKRYETGKTYSPITHKRIMEAVKRLHDEIAKGRQILAHTVGAKAKPAAPAQPPEPPQQQVFLSFAKQDILFAIMVLESKGIAFNVMEPEPVVSMIQALTARVSKRDDTTPGAPPVEK